MTLLSLETVNQLPDQLAPQHQFPSACKGHIVHIGVGAFHRSHQAWVWHQLRQAYPDRYADWSITGVCLMPSDQVLVDDLIAQGGLYALRAHPSQGAAHTQVVHSISNMLYGQRDSDEILDRLVDPRTKVISMTITEGGYDITKALEEIAKNAPATNIFTYLSYALAKRRDAGHPGLILMSCDNIQENGLVLRTALGQCLAQIDPTLKTWVDEHIHFPNSMVDRITPATKPADKKAFESEYGLQDRALVVSEDFFQWVLEDTVQPLLPPLNEFGVEFVKNVRPYEHMKLAILNAGHSLVGFLGEALGYRSIHESVIHPLVAKLFDHYVMQEAIPVLVPIKEVDYGVYYHKVKSRFANAMINDSTARIIGGSSDKIPKFMLPIVHEQLKRPAPEVDAVALVVAIWWQYLQNAFQQGTWEMVIDTNQNLLQKLFVDPSNSARRLLEFEPVFGSLAKADVFASRYFKYVSELQISPVEKVLKQFLANKHD